MKPGQTTSLQMPTFLFGPYEVILRKALEEGSRCAEQYLKDGSIPLPRTLLDVPPGEVLLAQDAVDFLRERPAWRLYNVSKVVAGLWEGLEWKNAHAVGELLEAQYRKTPWGALFFMISHRMPMSAQSMALRLEAVLCFWEPLQSVRYLFNSPSGLLTLEELVTAACDWTLTAWCPEGGASVRMCLEKAAERMARATRDDCTEAILRQLPRALSLARGLKHREVLADLNLWRTRLATLEPESFARMSAAWPSALLEQLYDWDKQLERQ